MFEPIDSWFDAEIIGNLLLLKGLDMARFKACGESDLFECREQSSVTGKCK